jgi:alpha-N-arabinofuranosidase
MHAEIHLHTEHRVAPIDERIFGGFLEHLGRAVYEGVYDPGNQLSDKRGFRRDVIDALKPMRMPVVRYSGGNFVSAYNWRDGVGPRDARPRRPDFAWRSLEPNQFGTDEFMQWCAAVGTAPMIAVNLGTGSPADAAELLEYCNLPTGTSIADRRAANGRADPYGVKLWCLGNEMDGFWHAHDGERARQSARAGSQIPNAFQSRFDSGVTNPNSTKRSRTLRSDACMSSRDAVPGPYAAATTSSGMP